MGCGFGPPLPIASDSLVRLGEESARTREKSLFRARRRFGAALPRSGSRRFHAPAFDERVPSRAPARGTVRSALRLSAQAPVKGSYLVDPASSHMLVSKIKPCMSKYKLLYTVKLRMAH